jgi:polyhydroxybutyrate depolymerase
MKRWLVALGVLVACRSSSFENESGTNEGPEDDDAAGASPTTPVTGDAGSTSTTDGGGGAPPPAVDATPPPPPTVVTNETVQVWGSARTFVMVAPKDVVPAKAYPVVFVFHGDGGNGSGMRSWLTLDAQSGADAIVVYPDGKNATWDLYTPAASNADNAFVDAMLEAVKAKYTVDGARVFGSGYSSGAFFINQIACRRSGFFRAIAPNAGGAPQEPSDPAATTWPGTSYTKCAGQTGGVAAIVMHGPDDYVVGTKSGTYDARYWAHVNGCDDSESTRTPTTPSPCVQHAGCPSDKRVLYCEIPGVGHGIWNESAKATWAFFSAQ